ncbi:hypothetical protein H6G00_00835 [Leptolyngbya sp. FACHB-541]|uniref:hypothetical protein n=1 Tax=Leptolyngbya sp. FACHB-541 TaxID=2692810 RepID=UPI0016862657|nr:hypothetical protein [Leptolyngbya sp. FACHB-541]MBD1995173.1 hypothetical protein [Leptolyngbya sp. FACHB-541]
MSKGFGKQGNNPIATSAEVLHKAASEAGMPLLIPMFPPGNGLGLKPGEVRQGHLEIRPGCDGIVAAVHCSAEEAQEVMDLFLSWQRQRVSKGGGDRQ